MDSARRWQVASVVTAAASIGFGAFSLQRPTSTDVEPIDLDVVSMQPLASVDADLASASGDSEIVTPDLLERMPTGPSPASTASSTAASVASTASPDESSPSPASTASADAASAASPASAASVASAASAASAASTASVDD